MGEVRTNDKKPPEPEPSLITAEVVVVALAIFFAVQVISSFVGDGTLFGPLSLRPYFDRSGIMDLFRQFASVYALFATVLSLLFIVGIIYSLIRIVALEKKWHAELYPEPEEKGSESKVKNEKWQRVSAHVGSDNPSDWRLAILECDIMLDDLLDSLGYVGGTIGDKLKNSDFRTLNNAWEAHKIRNAIAHEGQDFTLTEREARRVVGLYESVFREFDYV